jgi:hypothetical protein
MLLVSDALMGVSGGAIRTERPAPLAVAVPALVAEDAVTGPQVLDFAADFHDLTRELVAQDLRLAAQGNRTPLRIHVVVAAASIDVEIGSAHADGLHAKDNIARGGSGVGNGPYYQLFDVLEDCCFH